MKIRLKRSRLALYKEKVVSFRDYAQKYPDKELFPLFTEWADGIELFGIDRHEVWRRARKLRPPQPVVIREDSEEWVRIHAVLDIPLEADNIRLEKLLEKKKQEVGGL